jgi:hypothetical protein
MSDQLYSSNNLSGTKLMQGSAAATALEINLGVSPIAGSLTAVTLNLDTDNTTTTFEVNVGPEGAPVAVSTATAYDGVTGAIELVLLNGGAAVEAGDLITIALSSGQLGASVATAVLS